AAKQQNSIRIDLLYSITIEESAVTLRNFLEKYDRNVLHVAALLGIGKSKIYQMLKNNEL
ncbi:MAG: sigma-54-dependent Fis family transcriptional regulator, partial [Bacteroidota bacterium]